VGKREEEPGMFDSHEKTILIIILAGIILIGLLMGSSCNLHIEIKQKPTKVDPNDPKSR
jgi:hypothetical protein